MLQRGYFASKPLASRAGPCSLPQAQATVAVWIPPGAQHSALGAGGASSSQYAANVQSIKRAGVLIGQLMMGRSEKAKCSICGELVTRTFEVAPAAPVRFWRSACRRRAPDAALSARGGRSWRLRTRGTRRRQSTARRCCPFKLKRVPRRAPRCPQTPRCPRAPLHATAPARARAVSACGRGRGAGQVRADVREDRGGGGGDGPVPVRGAEGAAHAQDVKAPAHMTTPLWVA